MKNKSRIISILVAFSIAAVIAFCVTKGLNDNAVEQPVEQPGNVEIDTLEVILQVPKK